MFIKWFSSFEIKKTDLFYTLIQFFKKKTAWFDKKKII